jgi:microcystin-dependent protein
MDGTIAEIRMLAAPYAPAKWALCNGQLLGINTNQALYSLLGDYYGGDGITTFALPDMRGRVPVATVAGGTGVSNYNLGQKAGAETTALTAGNLPSHSHAVTGSIAMLTTAQNANTPVPSNNYFASDGSSKFNATNSGATMSPANLNLTIGSTNTGSGLNNRMPFLAINYIICVAGIYPQRP